jgi:acyl carrier protein
MWRKEEMTKNEVTKEVISIIADVTGYEPEDITPETDIVKDLEVDSIKAIEITVAIEKKFKVSIRDEDVPKIVSIKQAAELLEKLLSQVSTNVKA